MAKYLFLDIDGVLNSESWYKWRYAHKGLKWINKVYPICEFDPKAIKLLNNIIYRTGAKIVISSSWRIGRTVKELSLLLQRAGLKYSVYSKTKYHFKGPRGREIAWWLDENNAKTANYVILDDDTDILPDQAAHFVHTNWISGLTYKEQKQVISILNKRTTWNT
jgi:histidinol phosphatase-like enzyme